ncbi:MAG: hypothetical protein JNM08_01150 [Rubrivivax sp.]|nr:hypothetical protein [Rubrivivax sp.]
MAGRLLAALAVVLGLALVWGLRETPPPSARQDPAGHAERARAAEVKRRFDQAVLMLHAKQYEHAITALHRVLELAPRLPEAHANMGFALSGLQRWAAARDFFQGAIELEPRQANAYYGLGLAADALGDRALAKGAMRSYLHLARSESEAHLARARSALWEWEQGGGR